MKKNVLKMLLVSVLIVSCSSDDSIIEVVDPLIDPVDPPVEAVGTVVLNEVTYLNDSVEIYNNSDTTVDLEGCLLYTSPSPRD